MSKQPVPGVDDAPQLGKIPMCVLAAAYCACLIGWLARGAIGRCMDIP